MNNKLVQYLQPVGFTGWVYWRTNAFQHPGNRCVTFRQPYAINLCRAGSCYFHVLGRRFSLFQILLLRACYGNYCLANAGGWPGMYSFQRCCRRIKRFSNSVCPPSFLLFTTTLNLKLSNPLGNKSTSNTGEGIQFG